MSTIQWTDVTDNIIYVETWKKNKGGHWCRKVSPGCDNCYAERLNKSKFFPWSSGLPYRGKPPGNLGLDRPAIERWGRMTKPKNHFVCSMTDLFGEWIPYDWHEEIFDGMVNAPKQTFQLLTKRPHIALKVIERYCLSRGGILPPNIWIGVSVESQKYVQRIDVLDQIPAQVRFLSVEPLLERVDLSLNTHDVHWVIAGGESGVGDEFEDVRPCDLDWLIDVVEQCLDNGVSPFVKQLGTKPVWKGNPVLTIDRKGEDINDFPRQLHWQRFPALDF